MFSDSSFAVCVCVRVSEREVPGKVVGGEGIEGRWDGRVGGAAAESTGFE